MICPTVSVVIPTFNRKEKLRRLLNSILQSDYPLEKIEIIVVDDASDDGTDELIGKEFNHISYIKNRRKKLPATTRNIGLKASKGEFILLIDDDNIINKTTITNLVRILNDDESIGVAAPLMYYFDEPDKIWCAGIKRNMITSKATFIGNGQIDKDQFNAISDSDSFPNCFMIRREIIDKGIFFDGKSFPFLYEEIDFCERIKKRGYRVVLAPQAKIWHDFKNRAEVSSFETEMRTYYIARNRILFHKKYSKWWQFLIFILIFNWLFTLYYLNKIILLNPDKPLNKRVRIAKSYLKGILNGVY